MELQCPYCGMSVIGRGHLQKLDYDAVAALHAAETRLGPALKSKLQKQLRLASPRAATECEPNDLELDFNDIIEYGS